MGGGKSPSSQTVTQKSDPWEAAQPYLLDVLGQAKAAYDKPLEYYPFSTWIPHSPQTEAGLQQLTDFALGPQGQGISNSTANAAITLFDQAMNSPANPFYATSMMGGFDTWFNPSQAVNSSVMNMIPGMNPITGYMTPTANGSMLFSNPMLDATFNKAAQGVQNNVNAQFSGAGRYGSGAHQGVMQQGMNDLATQMYGNAFETERGRQMQAAGLIQQGWEGDLARMLQGGQNYALNSQQSIANRFTGAEGLQNTFNQGLENLVKAMAVAPQAYDFATAPGKTLMEVGGAYEQQAAQQLQDLMNRWMFNQESDWSKIQNYMGVAASMGGMGGMSTQTSPFNGPTPFQNMLSGASGGLGIASALGINPLFGLLGGLGGLLFG
jgi:hypothetical protein